MNSILETFFKTPSSPPLARRGTVFFLTLLLAFRPLVFSGVQEADLLYKNGKFSEAAQAYEKVLESEPPRSLRSHIYVYLGKSYESSGRTDKAIAAYEESVSLDPRNWRRHRDLARLYEQAELYRKALNGYEKALHYSPKEPDLFFALGRVWRKLGLYTDAERWLIKAKVAGYDSVAVQSEFSRVYEGQGRFEEAALAWSQTSGEGRRLFYLAALAHDDTLLGIARERMKTEHVSPETSRTYENLVQLLARSPQEILAGKTNDPTLQLLLKTQIYEDK